MLNIQAVGTSLTRLYADAHMFYNSNDLMRIINTCQLKLMRNDVKGFIRYLQCQSSWYSGTFDIIVSHLFEDLGVVGTCRYSDTDPALCVVWEDFESQYLTEEVAA